MSASIFDEFKSRDEIEADHAALLIIDMQNATGNRSLGLGKSLTEQGKADEAAYRFDRIEQLVTPNIQRLAAKFRELGRPVIYITYGAELPDASDVAAHVRPIVTATGNIAGLPEHDIVDALKPLPGEAVLNKTTIGAFASTGIDALLRAKGVTQVICTGVSTNYCVGTTACEAIDRGYQGVLVSDATGTASPQMQAAFEETFTFLWGPVETTDSVLAALNTATPLAAE